MPERYKAIIEYDGTDFCGWQLQPGAPSVQEEIETAIRKIFQKHVRISAAGRTDAGVHALGQAISFLTDSSIPPTGILKGTNTHLPESIRVVKVEKVSPDFHPRRDAVLRWYRYHVINRSPAPVWGRRFLTHIPYRLDSEILEDTASLFLGSHDFSGFRSADCEAKRTRLTLETFQVSFTGNLILIDLRCRSFLQNMVRILVGGILEAARGKIPLSVLSDMLESGRRDPRVPTAPAKGLTLMKVYYPGDKVEKIPRNMGASPFFEAKS